VSFQNKINLIHWCIYLVLPIEKSGVNYIMKNLRHSFLSHIVPTTIEKAERVECICGTKKIEMKRLWLNSRCQEESYFIYCFHSTTLIYSQIIGSLLDKDLEMMWKERVVVPVKLLYLNQKPSKHTVCRQTQLIVR